MEYIFNQESKDFVLYYNPYCPPPPQTFQMRKKWIGLYRIESKNFLLYYNPYCPPPPPPQTFQNEEEDLSDILESWNLKHGINRTYPTSRQCVRNYLSSKDPTPRLWIGVSLMPFLTSKMPKFEMWHLQDITYVQKVGQEPPVLQGSNPGDGE